MAALPLALVLLAAAGLAGLGGWGLHRLLAQLALAPAERLALTLALLPGLLGLAAFAGLLVGQPGPLLPAVTCLVLAAIGGVVTIDRLPQWNRGRRDHLSPSPTGWRWGQRVRGGTGLTAMVTGMALYAAGTLGTTLLTPLSGGALRIGDWLAHWFLVLVYLGQPLPDLRVFTNRVGDFGVISRPPLYNLEAGLLVGAVAGSGDPPFWAFQLITPMLAVPLAAAGLLWARALGGPGAPRIAAALIGLSPFLIQNASYPWSKLVAATFVLLFLYLIRAAALARAPRRARQTFMLAAFCAGLGYLAHQTTMFYVLPTLAWLVVRRPQPLFRRPATWSLLTWALGGLAGLAAFGPWQGWVLASYGLRATLDANPASFGADVSETFGDWLLKGGVAIVGTLAPLPALTALARGGWPSLDQLLRIQLALLTGALGLSGCWLLLRDAFRRLSVGRLRLSTRTVPWLPLVIACGFLGQVMLQPNWHDTGDAAESMTPIVILGLGWIAGAALRLRQRARWLFFGLVLAEQAGYLALWLTWGFGSAWTRDPNAVLASRYELAHLRGLWDAAEPVGAVLLAAGLCGSAMVLWQALSGHSRASVAAATDGEPGTYEVSASPVSRR
ncbi:MAG: hypothetical protein AB7K36_25305 [Chloroflexota bacterium]